MASHPCRGSSVRAFAQDLLTLLSLHPRWRIDNVLQYGAVRKQIKLLEYHAGATTLFSNFPAAQLIQRIAFCW